MPESALDTAKLTKFYGEMSPTLETVKEALAVAGIDLKHAHASDLYEQHQGGGLHRWQGVDHTSCVTHEGRPRHLRRPGPRRRGFRWRRGSRRRSGCIQVRAGLHTGEIELRGDDIAGIAVHVWQRVASHGGPSEVLISRTVADLIAGSDIELLDRGEHELKGVPGIWRLFQVRDERDR